MKFKLNKTDKITLLFLFIIMPVGVFVLEKLKFFWGFGDITCTFILWGIVYVGYVIKLVKLAMAQYKNLINGINNNNES